MAALYRGLAVGWHGLYMFNLLNWWSRVRKLNEREQKRPSFGGQLRGRGLHGRTRAVTSARRAGGRRLGVYHRMYRVHCCSPLRHLPALHAAC